MNARLSPEQDFHTGLIQRVVETLQADGGAGPTWDPSGTLHNLHVPGVEWTEGPDGARGAALIGWLHCQEKPQEALTDLEALLEPGARVVALIPFGWWPVPWRTSWRHVFTRYDLRCLFSRKHNLFISSTLDPTFRTTTGRIRGVHVVTYQNTRAPSGPIDFERKARLVAPRDRLSVCMVAKDSAGMLGRVLDRVKPIADELILVDAGALDGKGSTDGTREVAQAYGAIIRDGSSPLLHGFEVPRNESIEGVSGDWVLWLDSDEELVDASFLSRYLRHNCLAGYCIRQHHFSCDLPGAFRPDTPVRVFRNHGGIRFYGLIHEHPETAINDGPGRVALLDEVHIAHLGFLSETVRRDRVRRNTVLLLRDRQKYPDRLLGKHLLNREHVQLARYDLRRYGRLTDAATTMLESVVASVREDFMGLDNVMTFNDSARPDDAIGYYSDALRMLGRGFEVTFGLTAAVGGPVSLDVGDIRQVHFDTAEDAESFFSMLVRRQVRAVSGRYV